jgi:DNA repair protein RecN (Recombination protein N)
MLKSLYVSNYALISELNIGFDKGFSVITGETGAGKSIILGALSLILGQRADSKSIKNEAEKCIIEAEFDISNYKHLDDFFLQNDLDKADSCLIRRELTSNGKSRSFINDTPVQLNVIRDLSNRLIDIHSQHENLLLSNENFQLDVVDIIAKNSDLLASYSIAYKNWHELQNDLKQLRKTAEKQAADIDYIQFQYNQLTEANLIENELEELEAEHETLSHAEEIKLELNNAKQLLENEQMTLSLLKESISAISRIRSYIPNGNDWFERLQSSMIEIKDIASEISNFEERIDFNSSRLEMIDSRISELYTLLKKYKVAKVSELIELRENYAIQLQRIDSFEEEIEKLKLEIEKVYLNVCDLGKSLTKSRSEASRPIEKHMVYQLMELGMPHIQFQVNLIDKNEYSETGKDEVQFMFSANKNRPIQPVSQIASGGEVSRVMLTIKSLIAHKADLPTIIFDEIDTGVSGEIAHRMGEIMKSLAQDMQVIAITHLPQIAANGNAHYRVFKDDSGIHSETHIKQLTNDERILELAQMLSGKNITEAALKNATELLNGI